MSAPGDTYQSLASRKGMVTKLYNSLDDLVKTAPKSQEEATDYLKVLARRHETMAQRWEAYELALQEYRISLDKSTKDYAQIIAKLDASEQQAKKMADDFFAAVEKLSAQTSVQFKLTDPVSGLQRALKELDNVQGDAQDARAEKEQLAAFEAYGDGNEIIISDATLKQTQRRRPTQRPTPRTDRRNRPNSGSSNRTWAAFSREDNLWIRSQDGSKEREEVTLTKDGTPENTFRKDASRSRMINMQYTLPDPPADSVDVRWSPNGQYLLAFQTRKAPEKHVSYIRTSPPDQFLPKVETYPYARAGDSIPTKSVRLFSVADREEIKLSSELMNSPFDLRFLRWSDDSSRCWLLYNERGHQSMRVLEVAVAQGTVTAVIDEKSDTFIHYSTSGKFELEWLPDDQLLWASERSGWNHLYRYDLNGGGLINAVTTGNWNVRRIERIDRAAGVIWFYAVGLAADQDPYHEHFCRVNFDGSGFLQLTSGDGTHRVTFSDDRKFFFDSYSRVDLPPVTELRRAEDGSLVTLLETADATRDFALNEWGLLAGLDP